MSFKAGLYSVRGTVGPSRTEPVSVNVYDSEGTWFADFEYEGEPYSYRPRLLSPHPERVSPRRAKIGVQQTVTSVAREAFKAAKEAAAEEERNMRLAAQDDDTECIDDVVMRGIARRSMGVST